MRILGIDPGYDRLGLAIVEGDPSRPTLLWSMCALPAKGTSSERLGEVHAFVEKAIRAHKPDLIAIETLFFSTNRKTALGVAEARGAVLSAAGRAGLPVAEYPPAAVKLAVTGYGAADKGAIARMVPKLLSLPARKRLDDELDAIAVAITGLAQGYPQKTGARLAGH